VKLVVAIALMCGCDATLSFEEGFDAATDTDASPDVDVDSGCATTGCPLDTLHCDTTTGRCEECVVDGDCPGFVPRCDPVDHKCWGCLEDDDCFSGFTCIKSVRRCARSCYTKEHCTPGTVCDTVRSICIQCMTNATCFDPARRHCQTATGRCEQCIADKDCWPTHPHCDPATFRCVACVSTSDCVAPKLCDPSRHTCVTP
jgi:hypothetical protein